ncbi:XRE family transcriptional regulator [Cryptosporangium aurantiacum]|uniref:HTH cro/C1-type domain-containing protein n=1 Tax=Cryptosporangium aurantiacum TaxID=134849 RepID=A0A1M7RKP2_9ACTN|nr:XRE family transcriptional regulator [Cryptosporangium aurantiacum]SHN46915.1 hypothetical protein SAMN05443668_11910 [Cryptosporangium aurantiacum]
MNHALRQALANKRLQDVDVATALCVDPKTVQRWCHGRRPRQRHRWALADLLEVAENALWPEAGGDRADGVVTVYPHRGAVPRDVWLGLFVSARESIDVLVYSGLFLVEDGGLLRVLAERAESGVRVRMAFGDPESSDVEARGAEEGIGAALGAKVRSAFVLARPLLEMPGVEARVHDTVLYNSLYRGDDDVLVNAHIYGLGASRAPVLHVRRAGPDSMASTYLASFERIWASSTPTT